MKRSIYIEHNGREIYTGKIVKDTFYRNFPFSKSVLWGAGTTPEVSMDKKVFDYVKKLVKKIVFIDTGKDEAFKIGIRKAVNQIKEGNYGEGTQVYIKKDLLDRIPFPKIPFVGFKVKI